MTLIDPNTGQAMYPSTGDPHAEVEPTDINALANRMFNTPPPGQADGEMSAEHHRMANRSHQLRGGAAASIPFDVYCPDELTEAVEKWRAKLQTAQDADAQITIAENKLSTARSQAIASRVDDENAELPDFNSLRAEVDNAEITAEAKFRQVAQANADMLNIAARHYPAWRETLLDEYRNADTVLRDIVTKLRQAASVRDDMMHAVVVLDEQFARGLPVVRQGDMPARGDVQGGARQAVNGADARRDVALTEYLRNLVEPETFAWSPSKKKTNKPKAKFSRRRTTTTTTTTNDDGPAAA